MEDELSLAAAKFLEAIRGIALGLKRGVCAVVERATGRVLCSCDPCAVLFGYRDEGLKYARVARQSRRLADLKIDDAGWIALALPIDLAFFLNRSALGRVRHGEGVVLVGTVCRPVAEG